MGLWYFALATVIMSTGFPFLYMATLKKMITVIKKDGQREEHGKIQTVFFINFALLEIIPIVFIVLGFLAIQNLEMTNAVEVINIKGPFLVTAISSLIAIISLYLITKNEKNSLSVEQLNNVILQTFVMIGFALLLAIPIVSLTGILTMTS